MDATDTPTRPKVLFLTNGSSLLRYGGAALRYAALHAALQQCAAVVRYPVRCPDEPNCSHLTSPQLKDPPALDFHRRPVFYDAYCALAAEGLREHLEQLRPTVVVASGLELWKYLFVANQLTNPVCVLDLLNAESMLNGEVAAALRSHPHADFFDLDDAGDLRSIEEYALRCADHVWTCTVPDADRISAQHDYPGERITVVPNAVAAPADRPTALPVDRLLFLGRLDWFPNYLAAEFLLDEVHPRLVRSSVELPLVIAGFNAPAPLLHRAVPPGIRLLDSPPTVDQLWSRSILTVPLALGGGSRLKILEAFAAGSPVISSGKGIEGIDATDGVHFIRADTADEMVAAVVRVCSDAGLRDRLTTAGFDLLRARYTPDRIAATIAENIGRLIGA